MATLSPYMHSDYSSSIFLAQIIHLILHMSKKILKRSEGVTKKKSPSSVMGEEKQDSWRRQQKMRWL